MEKCLINKEIGLNFSARTTAKHVPTACLPAVNSVILHAPTDHTAHVLLILLFGLVDSDPSNKYVGNSTLWMKCFQHFSSNLYVCVSLN